MMADVLMAWFEADDAGDNQSEVFFLECLLAINHERKDVWDIPSVWA